MKPETLGDWINLCKFISWGLGIGHYPHGWLLWVINVRYQGRKACVEAYVSSVWVTKRGCPLMIIESSQVAKCVLET